MDAARDIDSVDLHMQFVNEVLRKLHALFRNCLDFQSIFPYLRSHNLLTDNEWEVICKKDSREQQVDEFLKFLPHKGRNCLSQMMKCLQHSPEHSGHQDLLTELHKLVEKQTDNPTAEILSENHPQDSVKKEFEKVVSEFASTIKSLHLSETKILEQKLEQQNTEIKKLQTCCTDYNTTVEQQKQTISHLWDFNEDLKKTISDLKDDNEALRAQLLERESMSDTFESLQDVSCTSCEEESTFAHDSKFSSLPSSYSSTPNKQMHEKRCNSDLINQHSKVTQNYSIEDKMKAYQENLKAYRSKCQSLQAEKESLNTEKRQLEWEVSSLKQQLDTISIASHSSLNHHKVISHSCSSLLDIGLADKAKDMHKSDESDKSATEATTTSNGYLRRIASIIKAKRTSSRYASPEPQEMLISSSGILPSTEDYLTNAIYQGWLTKEGGQRKILKKRWCILSSQCFFYFEKEEDLKRPLGILYLTPDMEVTDSAKENWFEISNKSRTSMKSCKLDKNRINYVSGNHTSYHLQASCDDDKKKWIEAFQKVFESLNLK